MPRSIQIAVSAEMADSTDVVMPGPVRSPELARRAKLLLPNIEVLFTSGYTQNAIVHGGRLDPGVKLISKPYRRENLARKIRQMLANVQPIVIPEEALASAPPIEQSSSLFYSLRILVVENNETTQDILCEVLTKLGHFTQGVSSAEAALQKFEENDFAVLLTDVKLSGMSGLDLARKVHVEKPSMKNIVSSGYGSIARDEFEFETVFLPKPFNIENLKKVLIEVSSGAHCAFVEQGH